MSNKCGIGSRAVGKCWMRGLILDALLADIDDATVADALQIFLSGHEHERELFTKISWKTFDLAWMIAILWTARNGPNPVSQNAHARRV